MGPQAFIIYIHSVSVHLDTYKSTYDHTGPKLIQTEIEVCVHALSVSLDPTAPRTQHEHLQNWKKEGDE